MQKPNDPNKSLSYYTKDQRKDIVSKYNKQDSNFMDVLARIKNNTFIPLKYDINDLNDLSKINVDDPNINWDHIINKKVRNPCEFQCEQECKTKHCQEHCPRECVMKRTNEIEQLVWDSKPRVKKQGHVGFAGGRKRRKSSKKRKSKRRKSSKKKRKSKRK
jgi:hypothetical protein